MNHSWTQEDLDRFLRCPATGQSLRWADAELLRECNRRIEAGQILNQVGVQVTEPMDAALINESKTWIYPCYGGLPTLLVDEAIGWEK